MIANDTQLFVCRIIPSPTLIMRTRHKSFFPKNRSIGNLISTSFAALMREFHQAIPLFSADKFFVSYSSFPHTEKVCFFAQLTYDLIGNIHFCFQYSHNVAPSGKWLAFVSTNVETPNPESELAPGIALLGAVEDKFVEVKDVYAPIGDGKA